MVKKIVRDPLFLAQRSEPATEAEQTGRDGSSRTLRAESGPLLLACSK